MRLDELNNAWEAAAAHLIAAEMTFAGDFLVLGAQTCLAKVGAGFDEARVGAVLAAAHGRAIGVLPLRHVRRAVETWRDGEKPLALIHLALSGLTKLANPTGNARHLFFADALIAAGVDPSIIVKSLGFDAAPAPLDKYNPDQPRVAAGSSDGGQWTSGAFSGAPKAATTKKPIGVQVADASDMRGNEVASDAPPEASANPPDGAASPAAGSDQAIELTQNFDSDETCSSFIAANCQARILRVFPGQYLGCTLRELQAAADAGDAAARMGCKLLKRREYRK